MGQRYEKRGRRVGTECASIAREVRCTVAHGSLDEFWVSMVSQIAVPCSRSSVSAREMWEMAISASSAIADGVVRLYNPIAAGIEESNKFVASRPACHRIILMIIYVTGASVFRTSHPYS